MYIFFKVYDVIADSEETHKDFLAVKVEMQALLGLDLSADQVLKNLIKTYRIIGKAQLKTILRGGL